jgi:subtilisin
MARKKKLRQYVLLPPHGLRSPAPEIPHSAGALFLSLAPVEPTASRVELSDGRSIRVIDSIHVDGAKLVEMTPEMASDLRARAPGLRIVPLVYYYPTLAPKMKVVSRPEPVRTRKGKGEKPTTDPVKRPMVKEATVAAFLTPAITVTIASQADGTPVFGALVVAFTDFDRRVGDQATTNRQGVVNLKLGRASANLERLYIYPKDSYWGSLQTALAIKSGQVIAVDPIDFDYVDGLRYFYGTAADNVGAGVTVGVLDSGIDLNHADLKVQGGENTVTGEQPGDFGDNGGHHGTHVAGIIAARGVREKGMCGLAPGVTLRSYRVFGKGSDQATNFAIAKAIDRAVADGCDLINMSLGGGPQDEATSSAIADARSKGTLVIVAAGNDSRAPVNYPAADPRAIAVSAMGRVGTFPAGAVQTGDIAAPYGTDKKNFIADFSNIGPEIALTSAGVGIVSTVPGGYAVMDGTSMACPAVTGAAARLLSMPSGAAILAMPRVQARSDAMARILLQCAQKLGFGAEYEGQGLPQPN